MNEDERLQLLGLLPERIELGRTDFLALNAATDGGADQSEVLHAVLELLGGEFGELQRNRRVADETAGDRLAHLRDLDALEVIEATGKIAVGAVPEGVDAERLHVDAVLVHVGDALGLDWEAEVAFELLAGGTLERRAADQVEHRGHRAVSVHVDGSHAAAADDDFAPRRGLRGRVPKPTADADHSSRGRRGVAQESSPIEHGVLPSLLIGPNRFALSCVGSTRASIFFSRRWIAGSSPAMTTSLVSAPRWARPMSRCRP